MTADRPSEDFVTLVAGIKCPIFAFFDEPEDIVGDAINLRDLNVNDFDPVRDGILLGSFRS